jgi:hypothetical protein
MQWHAEGVGDEAGGGDAPGALKDFYSMHFLCCKTSKIINKGEETCELIFSLFPSARAITVASGCGSRRDSTEERTSSSLVGSVNVLIMFPALSYYLQRTHV